MKILENTTVVHLMTWTRNPKMRNVENQITFIAREDVEIKENDVILGTCLDTCFSAYTITSITNIKKSAMSGYIFYTATTKWGKIPISTIYNAPGSHLSVKTTENIASGMNKLRGQNQSNN